MVSLSGVENIILKFLKMSFSHLEKMFKRYSKNGGETSTFCHVAVLAREAGRLSSLRLEYDLDPKLEEGRTTSFPFSDRYHLVSLHVPARQDSPPSVGFEVSEVVTTVMRVFFRFLPSSAVFRELREQVSTLSHSLFGITGIAGITEYQSERADLSRCCGLLLDRVSEAVVSRGDFLSLPSLRTTY